MFCSEKLSFLPFKNQNKSLIFSSGARKFYFSQLFSGYISVSITETPLPKTFDDRSLIKIRGFLLNFWVKNLNQTSWILIIPWFFNSQNAWKSTICLTFDMTSPHFVPRTTDAQWSLFHWYSELLGLGRQVGQINSGAFGVLSAKLSAPILVQWVTCPCFPLFNHYFYKKLSLYIHIGIWIWSAKN